MPLRSPRGGGVGGVSVVADGRCAPARLVGAGGADALARCVGRGGGVLTAQHERRAVLAAIFRGGGMGAVFVRVTKMILIPHVESCTLFIPMANEYFPERNAEFYEWLCATLGQYADLNNPVELMMLLLRQMHHQRLQHVTAEDRVCLLECLFDLNNSSQEEAERHDDDNNSSQPEPETHDGLAFTAIEEQLRNAKIDDGILHTIL